MAEIKALYRYSLNEATAKPADSKNTNEQKNESAKSNSASTSKTAESSKSAESSKPPQPTDPPAPKSAFDKPYDIGTIKSELIAYGKSIGMTHITHQPADWGGGQITPEGTTWLPPHETWNYGSKAGAKLKQDLCDRIKKWKSLGESTFTLWFEKDSSRSGEYVIYVIIG